MAAGNNPGGHRPLVEAAGQHIHLYRGGLDYAFILSPGCGACYPAHTAPDPSSRSGKLPSGSMSLYRAGLRLALYLPLGVAMLPCDSAGFADVSPVFTLLLRAEATITDRTRVRKSYTARTTCLAWLFESRLASANRRADAQPVTSTDPPGQVTRPGERLM